MNIEEKRAATFTLFGAKLPEWQDCTRCHKGLACRWGGLAYIQPCQDCRNTPEYEEEQLSYKKERSMDDMIKVAQPTAVYEIMDKRGRPVRNIKINNKGNIIQDDPWKPLKTGK